MSSALQAVDFVFTRARTHTPSALEMASPRAAQPDTRRRPQARPCPSPGCPGVRSRARPGRAQSPLALVRGAHARVHTCVFIHFESLHIAVCISLVHQDGSVLASGTPCLYSVPRLAQNLTVLGPCEGSFAGTPEAWREAHDLQQKRGWRRTGRGSRSLSPPPWWPRCRASSSQGARSHPTVGGAPVL